MAKYTHEDGTPIKTQFGIRPYPADFPYPMWDLIAVTPSGRCFRLSHAQCDASDDNSPAIETTEDFRLAYVKRLWKEDRRGWQPDNRGAAGVKVWLN
jgi:hypothetical protein